MAYEAYDFKSKAIEKLIHQALAQNNSAEQQDFWERHGTKKPAQLSSEEVPSLLENLPEYRKLSLKQKKELKFKEEVYHLSNLLAGEHEAVFIAAQVLVDSPQDIPDWTHAISTVLFDETKHFNMLKRYLKDKIGLYYAPHPQIQKILTALIKESSPEIKMFVSQVVLEWTATSLLASLLCKKPEPLLGEIIKIILKDEGRHLAFNRLAFAELYTRDLSGLEKNMEDMMFEAIVCCISSFFAIPVWQEYGFSKSSCRQYALESLKERGVMHFYSKLLPIELRRCHLHSERLIEFLEKDLAKRIIADHWSFEPKAFCSFD